MGYELARWIQRISDDVLRVEEGSLYPALYRLERRGFIASSWALSENNRRARYYELTPKGRRELEAETATWERLAVAIGKILQAT